MFFSISCCLNKQRKIVKKKKQRFACCKLGLRFPISASAACAASLAFWAAMVAAFALSTSSFVSISSLGGSLGGSTISWK